MAESNSTLTQDVSDVIGLSYPIEALLTGALSLLDEYGDENGDGDGRLFHARQLIEMAMSKNAQIYHNGDDKHIIERVKTFEAEGVSHV